MSNGCPALTPTGTVTVTATPLVGGIVTACAQTLRGERERRERSQALWLDYAVLNQTTFIRQNQRLAFDYTVRKDEYFIFQPLLTACEPLLSHGRVPKGFQGFEPTKLSFGCYNIVMRVASRLH
eukprot:6087095-Pyramimonas_sp.AAC.1